MNTAIASVAPATDWAWDQITSPNVDFSGGPFALVLLAHAYLADSALNSPNGYEGVSLLTPALLTQLDAADVIDATNRLVAAGLLVVHQRHASLGGGSTYRIPEEAFNR